MQFWDTLYYNFILFYEKVKSLLRLLMQLSTQLEHYLSEDGLILRSVSNSPQLVPKALWIFTFIYSLGCFYK